MKKCIIKLRNQAIKFLLRLFFFSRYRVKSSGRHHIPAKGGVLLLGNHLSYIDWIFILLTCPRIPYFAIARDIYYKFHLNILLKFTHYVFPISREGSKEAIVLLQEQLKNGRIVVVFPEGRMSLNGQMGEWFRGFEKIVEGTGSVIVPFYLLGLWGSLGSHATRISKRLQKLTGRHVYVAYGEPLAGDTPSSLVKQAVFKLSIHAWEQFPPCQYSVAYYWLLAAKKINHKFAVADSTGAKLSSMRLIVAVRFLQRTVLTCLDKEKAVGVILPLSVGGVMTNLALFASGKIVVNLNYTAGSKAIQHAMMQSEIKTIITSRQFLKRLKDRGFELESILDKSNIIYLEEIRAMMNKIRLFLDLIYCWVIPFRWLAHFMLEKVSGCDVAAIMFSSGSEGTPKGVELTNQNLSTNALQAIQVIGINQNDILLSTLPLFHAFGLTVNMLVPIFSGAPFVCQPDPTDAVMVGKLVHHYQASILTGTPTFLNIYSRQRKLPGVMLQSLRLVISGAEKLTESTRERFILKFGQFICEGYGATETSPVASVSLLDAVDGGGVLQVGSKKGSVGLPLPGTAFKIVDPETGANLPLGQAGLILIGGPQIKKGYLKDPHRTDKVISLEDNIRWYKSGDKGYLDEDGFLFIVDRYSRFAKIGGEMVSLTAVEQAVLNLFKHDDNEEIEVMAVSIPDEKKGEAIILFYVANFGEHELQQALFSAKIENIMLPSKIVKLDALPKLGSGKNDYVSGKQLALNL